jgi:hypothetical protein
MLAFHTNHCEIICTNSYTRGGFRPIPGLEAPARDFQG